MRALAIAVFALTAGCCSISKYEDLREEKQRLQAELEKQTAFTQGAQDDNAMLMRALVEQQGYINSLEMGAVMQAEELRKARENCEI